MPGWAQAAPAVVGMEATKLMEAREYALRGGGSGIITRHGQIVLSWGDLRRRYDLKSSTKSFGSIALGLALKDGKLRLADLARRHHPTLGIPPKGNRATGWLDQITIRDLASQTAGFEKPGGYTKLLFKPGTRWDYSDSGPNWLAECITLAYRQDLDGLMFERVFTPLGIQRADLVWRKNAYRPKQLAGVARREFGSGILANVDAMARIGYLMLREGRWQDRRILDAEYVRLAVRTPPGHEKLPVLHPEAYGQASRHYGLLWWNNVDGAIAGLSRDAYWSWGLYDSLILVIPSLDIVAARAGKSWPRAKGASHYAPLTPFLVPIAQSVVVDDAAPYPPSTIIAAVEWAPTTRIVRLAKGSDNWPLTWGDDDALYTAYGDGWGFKPRVERKLSLGLARIGGMPPELTGENLRSPTAEQIGDGKRGQKASGMLCVEGVLYVFVRNAGNSQLGWSSDHGMSWTWADWRFTTSFGCPTFLNYGRDYEGARDEYVYVYSPDADSAYEAADRMVLARVPKGSIRDRGAYEFLRVFNAAGKPVWTRQMAGRGAVFGHPGRCYRSGITYNPALRRYIWVQILPQSRHPQGPRFQGGFGIYEAPEPWGPWRTAFFTENWDVGPGETASFPTKWMGPKGHTMHLVFSGDDSFSVRACQLKLRPTIEPDGDGGGRE
jgi:CubicO group peptidase (beta-lactamase class C family)